LEATEPEHIGSLSSSFELLTMANMSIKSLNKEIRKSPWTLKTIGEVIRSMEQLKKKGLSDKTPIVWCNNEKIENIMIIEEDYSDGLRPNAGSKSWVEITLKN